MENKKQKIIILYSDLEGTILRESDREYDDADMYDFLSQLDKLQQLTDATIKMHIVSPVDQIEMTKRLGQLDSSITNYRNLHKGHKLSLVDSAAAYPVDDRIFKTMGAKHYQIDHRILELKKPISANDKNPAGTGKFEYVQTMSTTMQNRDDKEVIMQIYCGNGRNDLLAMDFINKQKNGFVVCPSNTRTAAKEKTQFVSKKTDLPGITEGIARINMEIEKRTNPEQFQKKAEEAQKTP